MLKEPVILEVAKDTYLFNLMGMQSPALIVGAERAMLIDTGLGNVDMTEQVRRVTDKPIMLVLSHAHSDHMGGIGQFEDIYLHPADIPRAKAFAASHLVDEAEPPLPQQAFVANCKAQFDTNPDNLFVIPGGVLPDRYAVHRFHPLKPDQVIDLGGRQVQILEERGHTAGEIAVLDFQSRILFAGDGLSSRFSVTAADIRTVYGDLVRRSGRHRPRPTCRLRGPPHPLLRRGAALLASGQVAFILRRKRHLTANSSTNLLSFSPPYAIL